MLKSAVLVVLLWDGLCQFSSNADPDFGTDNVNQIIVPKINETDVQKEQTVIYNFNVTQQILYVNGPLLERSGVDSNFNSTHNILRSDYAVTGTVAHKVHRRALPWSKARRVCYEEGGHLAVIRSEEEEKIVLKMMRDLKVKDAWVGYHNLFDDGDWISVFDEPLDESGWQRWTKNWTPCPDNYGGKEHCARLLRDGGGMDDFVCGHPKMFVCKMSIV